MQGKEDSVIQAQGIRRSFRSTKRTQGLKGALKLLIKPEYQTHEALKGVSFSIDSGSFVGLIGENGAGKTTLLKILSGLIPPSQGQARVMGYEPFTRPLDFRRKIALVMGQKAQLWWDLPAIDAFDLIQAIYEIPRKTYSDRLKYLAELLEVQALLNTQIRRLSLGERMKMELIGAILHWPSVIFLDEPTIGLDVLAAHKLREFLKTFNQEEKATIILTSHNMDDIERLCSRVLILRAGQLVFDGQPSGLIRQGEVRLRVRLLQDPTKEDLAATTALLSEQVEFSDEGIHFQVRQEQVTSILQSLMNKYQVIDMGIEEPSLESVIQRLYLEDRKGTL